MRYYNVFTLYTDPLNASDASTDPDNDGLTNLEEYRFGTNPIENDTDGDGMPDWWEAAYYLNGTNAGDALSDNDTDDLIAIEEFRAGSDPNSDDTDDDDIGDFREVRGAEWVDELAAGDYDWRSPYESYMSGGLLYLEPYGIAKYSYTADAAGYYRFSTLMKCDDDYEGEIEFTYKSWSDYYGVDTVDTPSKLWDYRDFNFTYIEEDDEILIEIKNIGDEDTAIHGIMIEEEAPFVYQVLEAEHYYEGQFWEDENDEDSNGAVNGSQFAYWGDSKGNLKPLTSRFIFNVFQPGYYRILPRIAIDEQYWSQVHQTQRLMVAGLSGVGSELEYEADTRYEGGYIWEYGLYSTIHPYMTSPLDNTYEKSMPGVFGYFPEGSYTVELDGNNYAYASGDLGTGWIDHVMIYAYHLDASENDTDGDGILDNVEMTTDRITDGNDDSPIQYTSPWQWDSDNDGIDDNYELTEDISVEVGLQTTNPVKWDTDDDFASDSDELNGWMIYTYYQDYSEQYASDEPVTSDPLDSDTDDDGLLDGKEMWWGSDPRNEDDTDGDGLSDANDDNPVVVESEAPVIGDPDADYEPYFGGLKLKLDISVKLTDNVGISSAYVCADCEGEGEEEVCQYSEYLVDSNSDGIYEATIDFGLIDWDQWDDLWEIEFYFMVQDENDNILQGENYYAGLKITTEETIFKALKVVASSLAFFNYQASAIITGFLVGMGSSIVDNLLMLTQLDEILSSLGMLKDALWSLLSNPSLIYQMLGDMWDSFMEKAKKLNPFDDDDGEFDIFNELFRIYHLIGYIISEVIDPVFGGLMVIVGKVLGLAANIVKGSKIIAAINHVAGISASAVMGAMKAAAISFFELTQRAAAHLARHVGDMFHYGSHGAGLCAAKISVNAGESISKPLYRGMAKSLKKFKPSVRNKLDNINFYGNKVSDTINDLVGKNSGLLDNIGNVKMNKIADILTTAQTEGIKWTNKQIEHLLDMGQYYHYANSGPLKHVDDLAGIKGINLRVKDWGTNIPGRADIAAEFKVGSDIANDIHPSKIAELGREFTTGSGKQGKIDIFVSETKIVEVKNGGDVGNIMDSKSGLNKQVPKFQEYKPGASIEVHTRSGLVQAVQSKCDIEFGTNVVTVYSI